MASTTGKRGYGTVVCDLERQCIVDLPPNRGVETEEAWLRARPKVRIISRDRGGGYGTLRAAFEAKSVTIDPLDLMIAAHALALDATLVSADQALSMIDILKIEDLSV